MVQKIVANTLENIFILIELKKANKMPDFVLKTVIRILKEHLQKLENLITPTDTPFVE